MSNKRISNTGWLVIISWIALFLIGCIALLSCSATRQQARHTKQAAKHQRIAFEKDRTYVAMVTRDSFPCITGKVRPADSSAYKSLLKTIDSINNLEPVIDKQIEYIPVYKDSIDCVPLLKTVDALKKVIASKDNKIRELNRAFSEFKPLTDTLPVADSAAIFVIKKEAEKAVGKITNEKEKAEKAAKRKGIFNWVLIGLVLAAALFIYILIKRK